MVRRLALSVMIVVSMGTICSADVELFTGEEGRFTILFADKPKVAQQVIKLPVGEMIMHIYTAGFPKQTGEMVMSYADYPSQVLATRKADEMLDDSVAGTIKGMKASLVKSERITQAGSPGRAFSWTAAGPKGPLNGQGRVFLVGPRLYQVLIVGTGKSLQLAVYDGIFESFKFKPAPPTTAEAKPGPSTKPGPPSTTKGVAPDAIPRATTPPPAKGTGRGKPAAQDRDRWITHTGVSFEGLWNVQMPTEPKHTTEPGLFGVKVRNVHITSDGKLTYTLKIQVTPEKSLNEGKESVLAAARDKLAEEVGGKVVEESEAQIAGYEGQAYRLEVAGPKPLVVSARAAIVGKRTVVLSVIGDRTAVGGPSAERFLDSFRVDK